MEKDQTLHQDSGVLVKGLSLALVWANCSPSLSLSPLAHKIKEID